MSNKDEKQTKIQVVSIFLYTVIGVLSTIGIIFGIIAYTQNSEWDLPNWITLVVEIGVGIAVATSILSYDRAQRGKISKLISEIKKMEENQQKIITEQYSVVKSERQRIEKWKSDWGGILLVNLESIYAMYDILHNWLNEYKQNSSPQLKANIISSAKRNGSIVEFNIQQIKEHLPTIQNYFEDTTLAMNMIAISEQLLAVFQSLHAEHFWEPNLDGTFSMISERKNILTRLIERLKKEIPDKSKLTT